MRHPEHDVSVGALRHGLGQPGLRGIQLGPACAHAGRVDRRRPSSARPTHASRRGQYLFTTAWPLQIFVQLVAAWAYKRKWSVLALRVPGERNVWADQLSRGNTSAFDSKPHARFDFAHMISGPINPRCLRPTRHGGRSIKVPSQTL